MIKSRKELQEYLEADYICTHKPSKRNYNYRYLKMLRYTEYYLNTGSRILYKIYNHRLNKLSVLTGICIPPNTFGKGLGLFHYGTIIINRSARFGEWCVVQAGVNVAQDVRGGDYVYLMPGVKINPGVEIGNHIVIGSNAVVSKSIKEDGTTWAGVPAHKLSNKGFYEP